MNLLSVSHRRQKQQADCLATCAAMVLDYLLIPFDYEPLLQLLQVRSFGAAIANMTNLESLGLFVRVDEGNFAILQAILAEGLPVTVALDTRNSLQSSLWPVKTHHAVLVIGLDETSVYVNDPAASTAARPIPLDEFELAWLEKDYLYAVVGLTEIGD